MRAEVILMILLMAAVTYVPRTVPAFVIDRLRLGKRMEKFLKLIPYTAMTALIFPAIISVDAEMPLVGFAGGLAAAVIAFFKLPVIVSVIGAVAVDLIIYLVLK